MKVCVLYHACFKYTVHYQTHTHRPGSLDRCVDGETARTILDNTPPAATDDHYPLTQTIPLQIRSLKVSGSDSLIQVLIFEPQNLINRLSKMEKLSKEVPKKKKDAPKKQGEAFKTYLMARRQFGAGRYNTLYMYMYTVQQYMIICMCIEVCGK